MRECESVVFVRCVGEDERGSGGGRVARLVFSPGPRVVETLTLPVSRALFFSLPESARRWEGPAGFLSGVPLRWRSRGGRSGLDRWRRFRWARHRVLRCLKYKGRVLGRERERERGVRLALRVCGACGGLWSSAGHPRCETHVLSLSLFRPPLFDRSLRVGGYWRRPTVCGGAISLSAPSLFLCRAACTCWA